MNLRTKVIVLYVIITLLIILCIGVILPISLQGQNLNAISEKSIEKSMHVDFALSNYINEAKYDVLGLSLNNIVRTPDDSEFTCYLIGRDGSFHFSDSGTEREIVDVLDGFQVSHPNVQSVYMGRENGAFVRSYAWENATDYDPRSRPWYILATENPGEVVITDPYIPITTPYVKIAIAKALVDNESNVYGVVGTDLNLMNLTGYITGIETDYEGEMILTDRNGVIIASRNESALFTNISGILNNQTGAFMNSDEGVLVVDDGYFVYYTSPDLGWKIGEIIPFNVINRQIYESILQILIFVIFALFLLSIITMLALNRTILRPLSDLTEVSTRIAETGDLDQEIREEKTDGEIKKLACSFKAMVEKIRSEEEERKNMEIRVADSIKQIEGNMGDMAILNDEIRNPLTVIVAWAEMADKEIRDKILEQVAIIDKIINSLDRGWLQSTKVWKFLNRYYGIHNRTDQDDKKEENREEEYR